ncbi:MAG: Pirin protein [Acidimicrobiales bacterium]|nr:Pirin protein [Acidimicrobiales bacterium]
MADLVLQTVPLGAQWPTIDPFLFCAHHDDAYPSANDRMGPDASLEGREIGQDFAQKDGWNMYHGSVVPGFPPHPHRGFETVTFVRKGLIDHADSLGAAARFGRGDVQWLTAGRGVVHSEMFPLLDQQRDNPLELFQIWLNLPATDKLSDPYFTMLWAEDIPRITSTDEHGRTSEVTVIAGELFGATPPAPPPISWAARPEADIGIWHVRLDPGASVTLPAAANPDSVRTIYVFEGAGAQLGTTEVDANTGSVVRSEVPATITAGDEPIEALVLQGRPIGEPVARYGPFVMNTESEIEQAFEDYRTTGFGGWPWPEDDPVHPRDKGRFARHADGRVEELDLAR